MATLEILQCFGLGIFAGLFVVLIVIWIRVYIKYKDFISVAQSRQKKVGGAVDIKTGDIRVSYDD